MSDKKSDHLLLSLRLLHRALDVSVFVSPLPVQTDITSRRKINTANTCWSTTGQMVALLIVHMAFTSFAMFAPAAKMVQVSGQSQSCE